jgi:histone H3/H4
MSATLEKVDELNFTTASIKRILKRGGVERSSKDVYKILDEDMKIFVESLVGKAMVIMKNDNRKTVQIRDVEAAAKLSGLEVADGTFL